MGAMGLRRGGERRQEKQERYKEETDHALWGKGGERRMGLFFVGNGGIVEGVVEAAGFFAFFGLTHNQIANVDDVAQLA